MFSLAPAKRWSLPAGRAGGELVLEPVPPAICTCCWPMAPSGRARGRRWTELLRMVFRLEVEGWLQKEWSSMPESDTVTSPPC